MADLTPLNLADSLESFLNFFVVLYFFKHFCFPVQTLLTNLNFHIAKYFSAICLLYLFHNLVYQTLCNFKLRGMKDFSSGPMKRRRGMKSFSNGLTWTNYVHAHQVMCVYIMWLCSIKSYILCF